jgi:hypothetical protein
MIELNFNHLAHELIRCRADYFHFRKYCKSVEPPSPDFVGGVTPFPKWEYLKQLGVILQTKEKILILKERQLFISWEVACYCLWFAMFHYGSNIPYFSRSGVEAEELLHKSQQIFHNLPDWMQIEVDADNTEQFHFKQQDSGIRAFTGSKYSGTSFTNSIVVNDEWDYHEYDVENWNAIMPTINQKGRQFIGISTVDKMKATSVFQSQARQALKGESMFTLVFFGRGSRPDRNEEWYKHEEKTVTPEEMKGLTRELYMAQNHPRTPQEALSPADTIAVIKPNIIQYMLENRKPPIKQIGAINIYRAFHEGDKYVCANDPSAGIGKDYHPSGIFNVKTGMIDADIVANNIGVREMYVLTEKMRELYNFPLWIIESGTEYGGVLIDTAIKSEAKNIFWQDRKNGKCGQETKDYNRAEMWAECANAINDGLIMTMSKEGIQQLQTLIYNMKGKMEAQKGAHDDYFSMLVLAWHIHAKVLFQNSIPIHTLTFVRE